MRRAICIGEEVRTSTNCSGLLQIVTDFHIDKLMYLHYTRTKSRVLLKLKE